MNRINEKESTIDFLNRLYKSTGTSDKKVNEPIETVKSEPKQEVQGQTQNNDELVKKITDLTSKIDIKVKGLNDKIEQNVKSDEKIQNDIIKLMKHIKFYNKLNQERIKTLQSTFDTVTGVNNPEVKMDKNKPYTQSLDDVWKDGEKDKEKTKDGLYMSTNQEALDDFNVNDVKKSLGIDKPFRYYNYFQS